MTGEKTLRETNPIYSVDVDEIQLSQQPLILERRGKPIAAVVSFDEYRRFSAWREERAARRAWVLERDPRRETSAEEWHAHFEAMDRFATHFNESRCGMIGTRVPCGGFRRCCAARHV